MSDKPSTGATRNADLTRETQAIWDAKAEFWDGRMGEGNAFHLHLVGPAIERLLMIEPDETVLDIACGNGQLTRRLAALGARVTASDFSHRFLELARARSDADPAIAGRIEYHLTDATDVERVLALGVGRFDAVVCSMALMDMTTIEPLLSAIPRLLKPRGRFVFAVPHPCFNLSGTRLLAEEEDIDGELVLTHWLKIADYLTPTTTRAMGMPGEPISHYYFHRPLHELLDLCFRHGMAMDGIEEPAFPPDLDANRLLSWQNYTHIPPVMVVRMRRAA